MNISIKSTTRVGGILYLIIIVTGLFGEIFVRSKLIVSGDATATATNIMASPLLWRFGIAGDLLQHVCDAGLMVVFFILLRPVNKNLALVAVFLNLIQSAVLVATTLNLSEALFLLGNARYLSVFEPQQLHALAYLSIKLHQNGFGVGLIFFGFTCLIVGYLIFRSGYLPRALGVMMQIVGFCYLVNSFALLLTPPFAAMLFPAILIPAFFGELSFCLWLLVKGVNVGKWEKYGSRKAIDEV